MLFRSSELAYLNKTTITKYVLDAIIQKIKMDRHADESHQRTEKFITEKIAEKRNN